ncbi:MAG TPA: methyltransferase [Spirochaetia bacterium]|nr:methyltransferase [Spirochaetia bacterium]
MKLKVLVGSGGRIMSLALPFLVVGVLANILWPGVFALGFGQGGLIAGIVLLAVGVPFWLIGVGQVLVNVPRKKLITTGPFAVLLHPMYTSVSLLVFPGLGLLFDSWVGAAIGVALYISSRIFAPAEDEILRKYFPSEYDAYRKRVLLPWL